MAYVPGYKYDIFISYAHLDNEKMYDKDWVEYFYKSLDSFLSERTGKVNEIKIWWDSRKLDGTKLFDNTIEDGLEQSAIMISLVSKYYMESQYCNLEMDQFSKKIRSEKTGPAIGDRSRMVHVLLQNIPFTEWPAHFSGRTGFPFYVAPDKARLGDTIKANSPEFINQMCSLRDSIEDLLKEFRNAQGTKATEKIILQEQDKKKNEDGFTIYFAEVPDSLATTRKRAMSELEKKGYSVLTTNPANSVEEHTSNIKRAFENADMSVHLLDIYPGREIDENANTWYPMMEAELALQSARSAMIWTPIFNMNDVEEENYKSFLADLDNGKISSDKTEVIHDHKAMITQHVSDKADQLKAIKLAKIVRQQSTAEEREQTQVLIDTNIEDQIPAWDLGRALLENGIQPLVNPGEKDPVQNINLLAERMNQVQKMVFYYGNADKEWIKQRMNAALHMAMDKDIPIDDFFVYMAPPDKNPQDIMPRQKFVKVNLIDSSKSTKEQAMNELVKQLKGVTA